MSDLQQVQSFWERQSCGEVYAQGQSERDFYLSETAARYALEPYIAEFAQFDDYADKTVLEIGVGMGSDHSRIAQAGPARLVGVDLTQRAIEHTGKRFAALGLQSELKTDNAEALSFADETFDRVYSWGVLHHSPNTPQAIAEVHRVLKPRGVARIMVYYTWSPTGLMLWARYGLLRGRPLTPMSQIYADYLESPGTKAYNMDEGERLFSRFDQVKLRVQLGFGDLLEGAVGQRHRGPLLSIAKRIWPRWLIRAISRHVPFGLYLLIEARK
ncbi:class I SAM-dependent methyltransferase [Magnetofaba australis]|uniref:Methyltransferase domain-containing protein n=1 Tax=Magnetofaba australis IT-1 TaxID=1434232 RepID=A0A1Y2K2B7_9PROT|nr:class I SAM-dependent methyltransferase [Magnetofaba australis]OSM02168.1 hypothetical protein MAIT1_02268 [Magnetofaba australis IT-1]